MAVYITGDTHGDFSRLGIFAKTMGIRKEKGRERDICIVLGDAGLNYFGDIRDVKTKNEVSRLPFDLFCIHGNHEMRPETVGGYEQAEWHGGIVYRQKEFPHLLFARDGEIYDFAGKKTLVIGGAYSVDKEYRLAHGYRWFPDEQPSEEIKQRVEKKLDEIGWETDIVLSHTCPIKYQPTETFIHGLDQSRVDSSTEIWLDGIEDRLRYQKWYCGHYHVDKRIDRIEFLFQSIRLFG